MRKLQAITQAGAGDDLKSIRTRKKSLASSYNQYELDSAILKMDEDNILNVHYAMREDTESNVGRSMMDHGDAGRMGSIIDTSHLNNQLAAAGGFLAPP